jgi:phosphoglucosamine mutase
MSGLGLTESLRRVGIDTATVDVGDKHVWERMRSEGFSLGGEQAGHIILADHMTTGDGILTAVYTMGVLLREGRGLHVLLAGFERFPQMLKNIRVDDKNAVLSDEAVCESLELARRKMMAEGRILLRASGTEPVVRIMAEAKEMALCRECITMVEDAVLAMQKKEQV